MTRLRAEAPFEPPGYRPFWALTKHADIGTISSQPLRFSSEHGIILGTVDALPVPSEMIVSLDPRLPAIFSLTFSAFGT